MRLWPPLDHQPQSMVDAVAVVAPERATRHPQHAVTYCAGPGRTHEATWHIRATGGHPWLTAACDKHRDLIEARMTVHGLPPTVTAIQEQP